MLSQRQAIRIGALCTVAIMVVTGCRGPEGDGRPSDPSQSATPGTAGVGTAQPESTDGTSSQNDPSAAVTPTAAASGAAAPTSSASAPTTQHIRFGNPFNSLYPSGFALKPLSSDPIRAVSKPERATSLDTMVIDPAYQTRVYRATGAAEGEGGRMRHEYSRRQAFNADQSRYLAQDAAGHWYLYDAKTFTKIRRLSELTGDCEPLWHPSKPNKLYLTSRNGGLFWWLHDVELDSKEVVFDFTGKTPWPGATSFWTKSEGTLSADGRYLALMATSYDAAKQANIIHGLVTVDLQKRKIVGTLDAQDFPIPGAFPDHISTSPSGKYAVPSWPSDSGGTRAYTLDFKESKELAAGSEHSDLAFGPSREDLLVYADYGKGKITATNLDTGKTVDLHSLYPASGEAYALHISGQAFDRPGWVVVSTYADSAAHGSTKPAPTLRAEYRKVWLLELKPQGRVLNVAHIRANTASAGDKAYFLEPQASASRDLSRIIFASNYGGGDIESYIVGLPTSATS